jgi:hypothetical protein
MPGCLIRHPEIQRGKLRQVRAEALFDGILVGGEEAAAGAAEKPAASIFLKACALAGCQPCEVPCRMHACLIPTLHDAMAYKPQAASAPLLHRE